MLSKAFNKAANLLSSFFIIFLIAACTHNSVFAAVSSSISISGMVVDKYSGKPVRDALVKCDDIQVRTTRRGCFFLPPLSYRPTQLTVSSQNYRTASVLVPAMSVIHGQVISLEPLELRNIPSVKMAAEAGSEYSRHISSTVKENNSEDSIMDLVEDKNLRLKGIEKSVIKSVRTNLFVRLKAERFQRRKELMKNWFPTDDIWWEEFEARRKKEKIAKKQRLEIAKKKYYDFLRESMYTEDIDTFITRLERERIANNATYSGVPDKYKLKKRDYKTYEYFEKLKSSEFIDDYQDRCALVSYNFGESPRTFDLYDPEKIDMGYGASLTGRIKGFYSADKETDAEDERRKALFIQNDDEKINLKLISLSGTIIDQATERPLEDVIIMVSEIHGSYREAFFSGEKGVFLFEKKIPVGDYVIEFYLPFYKYYSQSLNVRHKSEFRLAVNLEKGE